MKQLIRYLATLGPVGYVPYCPGTVASLVTVALMFALPSMSWYVHIAFIAIMLPLAIKGAGIIERECGYKDPSYAVVDEFIGMNVALVGVSHSWQAFLVAFITFRVFDILKPFPINVIERLEGGWGIIMDDVAAGLAARLVIAIIFSLWPLW
ncbi:MAG: phosphatidylglycerophosphatase A [Candidatus Babeliales bacterium]|jgi:phosphatidylglycerophosphatase A